MSETTFDVGRQLVATVEEVELDEEREAQRPSRRSLDELRLRGSRAAGRQHVVDDEHDVVGVDRVAWTSSESVPYSRSYRDRGRLPRQLAGLARGNEAGAELVGERAAEDEAARLGAHDLRHAGVGERARRADRSPAWKPSGLASSGVMSLKTTPSWGQSGMSRM